MIIVAVNSDSSTYVSKTFSNLKIGIAVVEGCIVDPLKCYRTLSKRTDVLGKWLLSAVAIFE